MSQKISDARFAKKIKEVISIFDGQHLRAFRRRVWKIWKMYKRPGPPAAPRQEPIQSIGRRLRQLAARNSDQLSAWQFLKFWGIFSYLLTLV